MENVFATLYLFSAAPVELQWSDPDPRRANILLRLSAELIWQDLWV